MTSAVAHSADSDFQLLSDDLKSHTARAHKEAEHSEFMNDLLRGKRDVSAFIQLQEQAWLFYTSLEEAARAVAKDPRGSALIDPRLERQHSLEHDLTLLRGDAQWRSSVIASPGTAAYVQRLHEIRDSRDLPRLLAHHYVRYLGDLSGGQVIARIIAREYDIDTHALSFYRFEGIDKIKLYKDNYREALNSLALSERERDALLKEAVDAFAFNHKVFAELG